jgi:hypothetical protein
MSITSWNNYNQEYISFISVKKWSIKIKNWDESLCEIVKFFQRIKCVLK